MKATPTKLRNGSWGARVVFDAAAALPPRENDIIAITTRSGKSWNARVERVLWTGDGVAICATASLDRPRRSGTGCSRCRQTATRTAQIWEECEHCGCEPIYM